MGLVLDEPKDDDSVFDVEGFQYLVNNNLLEKAKPIKIDFLQMGFKIDSLFAVERTGTEEPRYELHRGESRIGLDDLRAKNAERQYDRKPNRMHDRPRRFRNCWIPSQTRVSPL